MVVDGSARGARAQPGPRSTAWRPDRGPGARRDPGGRRARSWPDTRRYITGLEADMRAAVEQRRPDAAGARRAAAGRREPAGLAQLPPAAERGAGLCGGGARVHGAGGLAAVKRRLGAGSRLGLALRWRARGIAAPRRAAAPVGVAAPAAGLDRRAGRAGRREGNGRAARRPDRCLRLSQGPPAGRGVPEHARRCGRARAASRPGCSRPEPTASCSPGSGVDFDRPVVIYSAGEIAEHRRDVPGLAAGRLRPPAGVRAGRRLLQVAARAAAGRAAVSADSGRRAFPSGRSIRRRPSLEEVRQRMRAGGAAGGRAAARPVRRRGRARRCAAGTSRARSTTTGRTI